MGNFYPFLLFLIVLPRVLADLRVGFYQTSCPGAESLVRQLVQRRFAADRSVTAALLRMHFHDCFVRGCDASILIDSTTRTESEKEAGANLTVREFELIDQIKAALESACPNTVSCADVITLATRDAVSLAGGPNYTIPTGRRDGLVSKVEDVILPDPDMAISDALPFFTSRGLTLADMVTLLGAHTVGVSQCSFFSDRLTDFQGTGRPDPSMDPGLASRLSKTCASQTSDPTVFLDQNTSFVVDNEFYKQIGLKKGILKIDQELTLDRSSAGLVSGFATNPSGFKQSFGNAMVKLGGVQVLVGNAGEIRKNCRVFNPKKTTPPPPPPMKKAPPPPPPMKKAPPPPPPIKKAPPPPPPKKRAPPPPPPKKKKHNRFSKKKSPPRHKN